MTNKPEMMLWLSDSRGVYIPKAFADSFIDRSKHVSGVDAGQWETLEAGPDHQEYWETWQEVCDSAVITDENGHEYFIHQDGDCWLVPKGMEWNEDSDCFEWPKEDDEPPDPPGFEAGFADNH